MKEKILAALRKLGPRAPTAVANEIGESSSKVGYHMRAMAEVKELKASGNGRARIYGLPDQDLARPEEAPPQQRRATARKPRRKTAAKKAAPAARTAERFIPVVDAERRLYIINGAEPIAYNESQTLAIATLLQQHYEAA